MHSMISAAWSDMCAEKSQPAAYEDVEAERDAQAADGADDFHGEMAERLRSGAEFLSDGSNRVRLMLTTARRPVSRNRQRW